MSGWSSRQWNQAARRDLKIAQLAAGSDQGLHREAAFHFQQAAEKAIKAVLLERNGRFPYIHDLAKLLAELPTEHVPAQVAAATVLSDYYSPARYGDPDLLADLPPAALQEADDIASAVLDWADRQLP
jgi:HEPN domain-containing protein